MDETVDDNQRYIKNLTDMLRKADNNKEERDKLVLENIAYFIDLYVQRIIDYKLKKG